MPGDSRAPSTHLTLVSDAVTLAMANPAVYVAGVGATISNDGSSTNEHVVSAVTKALLDAGISFDNVDQGVVGAGAKGGSAAFKAFDERGINVDEAKQGSELEKATGFISKQKAECVLVITTEGVCYEINSMQLR